MSYSGRLSSAVSDGNAEAIREALREGESADSSMDWFGCESCISRAIENGFQEGAIELIVHGAPVSPELFHKAIENGQNLVVQALLHKNYSPNTSVREKVTTMTAFSLTTEDGKDISALNCAISHEHIEIINLLLDFGCFCDISDLKHGVEKGNLQIVKSIFEKRPDVGYYDATPLIEAIEKKKSDIIDFILSKRPHLGKIDDVLSAAVSKDNTDLIRRLKLLGANPASIGSFRRFFQPEETLRALDE